MEDNIKYAFFIVCICGRDQLFWTHMPRDQSRIINLQKGRTAGKGRSKRTCPMCAWWIPEKIASCGSKHRPWGSADLDRCQTLSWKHSARWDQQVSPLLSVAVTGTGKMKKGKARESRAAQVHRESQRKEGGEGEIETERWSLEKQKGHLLIKTKSTGLPEKEQTIVWVEKHTHTHTHNPSRPAFQSAWLLLSVRPTSPYSSLQHSPQTLACLQWGGCTMNETGATSLMHDAHGAFDV